MENNNKNYKFIIIALVSIIIFSLLPMSIYIWNTVSQKSEYSKDENFLLNSTNQKPEENTDENLNKEKIALMWCKVRIRALCIKKIL
jgi:flagellar basal body-associated protein FliL